MTTTSFHLPAGTQAGIASTGGWMAKRGVLLVFLQMPVAALVVGYALQLVSFPVATFAVFVSSAAFPAWVSYRTAVSDDPEEPVHHLHHHVIQAGQVVAACTAVLVTTSLVADIAPWTLWYDLGTRLTGESATGLWSLVSGIVVYGLVALCLATSYYVLVRRPRSCILGWFREAPR